MQFILDILILLPLAWGAYKGYAGGLLSELVGALHFSIAFAISFKVIGLFFKVIHDHVFTFHNAGNASLFPEVAFACSVGATFALLSTAGKYMKTEIEYDFPGAWDNIIGAIFGILKYAIVLSFFFWFITGFGTLSPDLKQNSITYNTIESIAFQLIGVTNDKELSDAVENTFLK